MGTQKKTARISESNQLHTKFYIHECGCDQKKKKQELSLSIQPEMNEAHDIPTTYQSRFFDLFWSVFFF
jgi:hypothetical protein